MSLCKGEGPSYPILKTFRDFLVKKIDFLLIVFSFPTPQVPSPPTKVSQNLIYFSGDPTKFRSAVAKMSMIAYTSWPDLCFEVPSMVKPSNLILET